LIQVVIGIPLIRSKKGFLSLMRRNFPFRDPLLTQCSCFWAYHSLCGRGISCAPGPCCFQHPPGQHQQVIRYDRTPEILPEAGPSRPGATGEAKRTLEPGNIRSMPARKFLSFLNTQLLLTILSTESPFLLAKAAVVMSTLGYKLFFSVNSVVDARNPRPLWG